MLIHKNPEWPADGPRVGACGTPSDDPPAQDKLQLPLTVALERNDLRAQGGGQKHAEKPASGKTPIARMENVRGQVIGSAECSNASDEQAPRDTARNGGDSSISLQGLGAADDVHLLKLPDVPVRIRISLGPDPVRPRRDNAVDDPLVPSRRDENDHIPRPHLFGTAGDESDPVPRSKQGPHAFAAAEDRVVVRLSRSTHAVFCPRVSH